MFFLYAVAWKMIYGKLIHILNQKLFSFHPNINDINVNDVELFKQHDFSFGSMSLVTKDNNPHPTTTTTT